MLEHVGTGAVAVDYLDLQHLANGEWEQKEKGKQPELFSEEHLEGVAFVLAGARAR